MARISFVLKDPNSKVDTPILYTLSYSGQRIKATTKLSIKPSAWNKKARAVRKNRTEYWSVQEELDRIEVAIKTTLSYLKDKYNG